MRALLWLLGILLLFAAGYYLLTNYSPQESTRMATSTTGASTSSAVTVVPIEHATGLIRWDDTVIYFDPTGGAEAFAGQPAADIILVTDIHGDHMSTSTLAAVRGDATLVVPQAVQDLLPDELKAKAAILANGETTVQEGITISATPMYNLPDADNADRHTKGRGNGYLLEKDGYRVLIAGDTAGTPELRAMRDIDVALVPMNLPYTMSVEEAADAVLEFKPRTVYPYHYRTPDGLSDVDRFKQLVNAADPSIDVVLAAWYPSQ